MTPGRILFTVLFIITIMFFARCLYRHFAAICLGRWENRFDQLGRRFRDMWVYGFMQKRVVDYQPFGYVHFTLFWGFVLLMVANTEFLLQGVFPLFSLAFLGERLYGVVRLFSDISTAIVILAVAAALIRRIFFRPGYINANAVAFLIPGLIGLSMIAHIGNHAGIIYLDDSYGAGWTPISNYMTLLYAGLSTESARFWTEFFWWLHAVVLLVFLVYYIPFTKHLHVLTAIPNCFFRSFEPVRGVERMVFEQGRNFGVSKINHLTWKDLLDFLACTECGRCFANCPASQTGKALNPREIIRAGKDNLFANMKALGKNLNLDSLGALPPGVDITIPLIGNPPQGVTEEEIWSCTTCGSCMINCPVFIEHIPKLVAMRRHLVMDEARFPEELQLLFENSEQRHNPWGVAPTDRSKWTHGLDVRILEEGESVEYLYFVGCAAAMDSRARNIAASMTRILNAAGVDWAILGNDERCCGDSLRRLGNEYVFERMANANMGIFERYGVKKVITQCPHCFHTLKNDYKQYGAELEVVHHTQMIAELLEKKRLPLAKSVNGRTVIHDSCYLGRYNNIYDEPRGIIQEVSGGKAPIEMERRGERSFCCGAGGGRMWMEENEGKRIHAERTQEALRLNPSTIAVSCPYCMTMFEDGIKDEGVQDRVRVRDVAEIVAEALDAPRGEAKEAENTSQTAALSS